MAETQTPAHPVAMDPPHITEFASKRYFEKLNQLNANQTQTETAESSAAAIANVSTTTAQTSPTFILPLRESKTADAQPKPVEQKKDKSRFFSIRQRVSLRHSKTAIPATAPALESETVAVPKAAFVDPTSSAIPFDQLFLALPNELQVQVISSLPLSDVLNLRLTSKPWHTLITLNEGPIVRYHIENHIPAYALRLYPINDSADYNFHTLCSIWHRLHVAAKLAYLMCEWITKDIFLQQTEAQRKAFAPQHEIMRRRLIPLLFTIFHFFETYRKLHLEHIAANNGHGLRHEPYTLNPIEKKIMDMYDDQTLLRVHEVFPLVISSFCRRLRPPTYVGRVERSLRGYLRERPADEVHVAILCLGGLRQVERLWEIKGYNSRRAAVDVWYSGLTKEPIAEAQPKARLSGLRGFGRKKSTSGDRPVHRSSFSESLHGVPCPSESIDPASPGYFDPNWVFHTSLAADVPMAALETEQADKILNDLPVLQQIWLTTAEALILERKIVSRAQDIKRNQQVMLDLIRQDGMQEEDEWWYGRHNPESVRPPPGAGAAEDDAD
ncbi:hypothetical protein LMH87_012077 [Akanthomyces muscarius]|uniref:F-box domain-containing protein n=1 Tax=Akanthomyces muscarius TaxID=2231603 RepID=A0A9W8QB06_AKAMU|nr:hypothetical protein LMH87_012077 [Akanthomyces muscarius]KAJ4151375.1 hypothetical protein LMH87_012077 [Akanthomyces muscarius]